MDFITHLEVAIEWSVVGEEARQQLKKILAYENANEDCHRLILPIKDSGTIYDFIKMCRNVGTQERKVCIMAATLAAAQKANACFGCGQPGHLRKNCPQEQQKIKSSEKGPPGPCPRCQRGYHWASECHSKANKISQLLPRPRKREEGGQPSLQQTKTSLVPNESSNHRLPPSCHKGKCQAGPSLLY